MNPALFVIVTDWIMKQAVDNGTTHWRIAVKNSERVRFKVNVEKPKSSKVTI